MALSEYEKYLFHEGTLYESYQGFGAHPGIEDGEKGTFFSVWAPGAVSVSVICEKNRWDPCASPLDRCNDGIYEGFLPQIGPGDSYKYVIVGADGISRYKADPYAFRAEVRPEQASIVCGESEFVWRDQIHMEQATSANVANRPMAVYEVHLGSWKRDYRKNKDGFLNYRELADQLADYLYYMGFTHVELIGICEYPYDGSWGYQVTGYYAPTSRYGSPDDFRYFVDRMHRAGIGVILDWVPAHFPKDSFGLENFDGTPLYESADPLLAEYPEWGTRAFDHSKPEVRSFLISNAFYWLKEFHIDALRVDAVASMLYTSFGRKKWRVNSDGGTENTDSIAFLRQLNSSVLKHTHGYLIAEDSSIMEGITRPVEEGGMGFLLKWNMGWMNDTLKYFSYDPVFRQYYHEKLTYTLEYAFLENFILVLSHDEVVHLKKSMMEKLPGSEGDKLGGLKALYAFQFLHPGKKLLFMGQEFAEHREWSEEREIDWYLASEPWHRDIMECLRNLLKMYREYPCLYCDSQNPITFEWVNKDRAQENTIRFIRRNPWNYDGALVCLCNYAPVCRKGYVCGVPREGGYRRVFSTYDSIPGGDSPQHVKDLQAERLLCDGREFRITYELRPYETAVFEIPAEICNQDENLL